MATVKFTTNGNCQGEYAEVILSKMNIKTCYGFRRAYRTAVKNFSYWKRQSPNYPLFIFINDEKIDDSTSVIMALSDDMEMRDDNLVLSLITDGIPKH